MPTGIAYDARFLHHDTGPLHPERPERLAALMEYLERGHLLEKLISISPRPATREDLLRIHSETYLTRLENACKSGKPIIDVPDSAISPPSWDVALLAAGAVLAMCDAVMAGAVENGFCAVRPPGHHAERDFSMGFCLLANVAIAAKYLQVQHHLPRIAIVDWDVHHGNGTQHTLEHDPSVLFISLHEHPNHLYPGTGYEWETGKGLGEGFTLNIPMLPGSGDAEYQQAFHQKVIPAIHQFQPQAILISAGFDATAADPLAHLKLTPSAYAWMTRELLAVARRHAEGRVISVLEGGYHLEALCHAAAAHITELLSG